MVCKLRKVACILATLFLSLPTLTMAEESGTSTSEANTYYEKGTTEITRHSLTKRMALVGHSCMVSRLAGGIQVGTGSADLENLCDEDLTNAYTIPSVADVTLLAGNPIIGVKDMKHYFNKDTKAGFKISGESSVLNISLLQNNFMIRFYKDGNILKTSEIEQAGYTVLNLNVGNINVGSDALDIIAKDQPNEDFDEIALIGAAGVEISAIKGLEIYYAFVGDGDVPLTTERIKKYNSNMTVEGKSSDIAREDNLCDKDLDNDVTISAILQLGYAGTATVMAHDSERPDEEAFPAGTEAGFVISTGGVINVALTPTIVLLDKDGNKVYSKAVSSTVLGLQLSGGEKKLSIKAPCAFSGIKYTQPGVSVAIATVAKYAFIAEEPDCTLGHECEMSPSANVDLCNCDSHYQLTWNNTDYPDATWSMVSTTDSKVVFNATDNTLDFSNTDAYINNTDEKVTVVMRLTNTDGCHQDITIGYGGKSVKMAADHKETPLVNANSTDDTYTMGDGTTVGVSILSIVKNSKNVISPKLSAHASYFGGVTIGDNYISSVKNTKGDISDGSKAVQAGFVVTAQGSGLTLDALKLMNVRVYKEGKEATGGVSTSAISAKLIGSADTHKVRYSITVPAGTSFDEIRLYSSGLLGADLGVLNIYYAYTADEDAVLDDPADGATVVSFLNTGASIDLERMQSINTVNAGNGVTNVTNCIDENATEPTLFPVGANVAGGTVLAVKLGKTASRHQQLVIVVNNETAGLGVKLADAMVVKTYKQGVKDPVETFSDWSVLGANIITLGDKGYVFIDPTDDYDEVTITSGNGVSALSNLGVYSILLRNDKDGNGVPDADEMDQDCNNQEDLVFQETVDPATKKAEGSEELKTYRPNITMYFNRTFVAGKWNTLTLPVNLNKNQFHSAFGSKAKLAAADKLFEITSKDNKEVQHVVGFKTVTEETNGVFLEAEKPYIIWMDTDFVNQHKAASSVEYNTWDVGTVSGEMYIVDRDLEGGGVTYEPSVSRSNDYEFSDEFLQKWSLTSLDFYGSYKSVEVPADNYIFNNGDMYHLSKKHTMKGFRCWLAPVRENSENAKALTFGFKDETTGIVNVMGTSTEHHNEKIYNLNGQQINSRNGIQPGIYIVNGKKVVVK